MKAKKPDYDFSAANGGVVVTATISADLNAQLTTLCNLLEMQRSSLIRSLLVRGVNQLEAKLIERAEQMRAQDKERAA